MAHACGNGGARDVLSSLAFADDGTADASGSTPDETC